MSEISTAVIAIAGTLAGGGLAGTFQLVTAGRRRKDELGREFRDRFVAAVAEFASGLGEYRRAELNRVHQALLTSSTPDTAGGAPPSDLAEIRSLRTKARNLANSLRLLTDDADIYRVAGGLVEQVTNLKEFSTTGVLEAAASTIDIDLGKLIDHCRQVVRLS